MPYYSYSKLKTILAQTRRIAMVGVSVNPIRPSYFVARYLSLKGYEIVPINPMAAGQILLGNEVLSSLSDIPGEVDMIDIFRRSDAVPDIVDEALALLPHLRTVWMQIGVEHPKAAAKAEAAGILTIQNRCPKIEHQRLFGELRKAGFNTGIISSRLNL